MSETHLTSEERQRLRESMAKCREGYGRVSDVIALRLLDALDAAEAERGRLAVEVERLRAALAYAAKPLLDETDLVQFHRERMAEHCNNAIASRKRAEELAAENARLREALRPFAREVDRLREAWPDWMPVRMGSVYGVNGPDDPWEGATLGDCRKAKEVLGE